MAPIGFERLTASALRSRERLRRDSVFSHPMGEAAAISTGQEYDGGEMVGPVSPSRWAGTCPGRMGISRLFGRDAMDHGAERSRRAGSRTGRARWKSHLEPRASA